MINSGVEKFNVGTMLFCITVLSVVFFFFGDSVKTSMKFIVTRLLSPLLSTSDARVVSKTIFQERGEQKTGQRSIKSIPKYQTVLEYEFNCRGSSITAYDADILYRKYVPHAMIQKINSRVGPGPVSLRLLDMAFDRELIPWFVRGVAFDQKSWGDSGFLELIKAGAFTKNEKSIPIHYLSFAPHYNDLESYPPGLRLFFGELERFAAVLMAAAMLAKLWNMAYKEYFEASRFTGYFVWLLVILFIFIFMPARSLVTVLQNRKYTSTFTIDEAAIKRIQLPPQ